MVQAQNRIRDFTEPVLVQNSDGHHAPVTSLLFTDAGGKTLLSGGMDKVIHQWNLAGPELSPTRTLRPPLWRGRRGLVRAMALSPTPDAQGQRILAVAGNGIAYNSADIVLFRYPGLDLGGQKTGDLIAHLPVAEINAPEAGHRDMILGLAFSPDGLRLSSASMDGTVRIWDLSRRTTVAVLPGHTGGVPGLAWPSANLIVTGDVGGNVRAWEVAPVARETARINVAFNEQPVAALHTVKALTVTPDARWLAVGDGQGRVTRLSLPLLDQPLQFLPRPNQGGVTALAVSSDGLKIASAHNWRNPVAGSAPDFNNREGSVELRSFPDGQAVGTVATLDDLITALLFSPDRKSLVYAGGSTNALHVHPIDPLAATPTRVLRGHGSSVPEIGFAPQGLGLAISRSRIVPGAPLAEEWNGFDFLERRSQAYATASLKRAESSLGGWSISRNGVSGLRIVSPTQAVSQIDLNPTLDGVIWSATLVAPRNAGGEPLVAIGCSAGVAVYKLTATPQRTRYFAGHEGEVLTIAASPDGKWLGTGSNDQTARLWPLADADKLPRIGATLEPQADGSFRFQNVERGGFIDSMGIAPGDVLKTALIDGKAVPFEQFISLADAAIPGPERNIVVSVLKDGPGAPEARTLNVMTSKRQSPSVSLFLADRPAGEWVAWTPNGFYDSSIGGDGKYLGWHLNQSARLDVPKPTLHYPVARFRDRFQQPEILRALLVSGDEKELIREVVQRALAEPTVVVVQNRPPQLGATITRAADNLGRIRVQATALSGAFIREINLLKGGLVLAAAPAQPNPARLEQDFDIALDPGQNRIGVAVTDDQGRVETQWLEVESPAPPPASKLWLVTEGSDRLAAGLPLIPHAEKDAKDLALFLAERLVAPGSGARFSPGQVDQRVLAGSHATSVEMLKELDDLKSRLDKKEMRAGDLLLLASSAQLVVSDKAVQLVGADLSTASPPHPAIAGKLISQRLGEFTKARVQVILVLDLVHTDMSTPDARVIANWIQELRDQQGVAIMVASEPKRASEPRVVSGRVTFPTIQHRLLTQGVLTSGSASAGRKVRIDDQGRLSLDAFHLTVNDSVREMTRGRQLTGCYLPDSVSPNFPFLDMTDR